MTVPLLLGKKLDDFVSGKIIAADVSKFLESRPEILEELLDRDIADFLLKRGFVDADFEIISADIYRVEHDTQIDQARISGHCVIRAESFDGTQKIFPIDFTCDISLRNMWEDVIITPSIEVS